MKGLLLDENLPGKLRFTPSLPVQHARDLGESVPDARIWEYAAQNDLVIVTKDTDFSDRMLLSTPPPRVVHVRFGNLRLHAFHRQLAYVWPQVERLLQTHKLISVYVDRVEAVT